MASHDPEIRSAAARTAAYAMLRQTSEQDLHDRLAKARAVQWQRDLDAVDPDGVLDPAERERRATFHRRERLARAGLASARANAKARRERKAAEAAAQLAAELDTLAAIDDECA